MTSKVLVSKLTGHDRTSIIEAVKKMADSLGGIGKIIKPGTKVLLKPDLRSAKHPEYSQPTSAELILALAIIVDQNGGEAAVADSPYLDNNRFTSIWEKCGLINQAGTKYRLINPEKETSKGIPVDTEVYYVSETFLKADIVINLPRIKVDSLTGYAGGLRNMLGVLPGYHKTKIFSQFNHPQKASKHLVNLYSIINPSLTIAEYEIQNELDGSHIDENYLIMSNDAVALDCVVSQSLGIPEEHDYTTRFASEAGLGMGWMENINLIGDSLPREEHHSRISLRRRVINGFIKTALNYNKPYIWMKPRIEPSRCDGCAECSISCPTKAMKFEIGKKLPDFNYDICISCWCCKENCPNEALYIESSKIMHKNMTFFRNSCAG